MICLSTADHAQTVQVLVSTYGFENHSTDAIGRLELLGYAAFGTFAAAHTYKEMRPFCWRDIVLFPSPNASGLII